MLGTLDCMHWRWKICPKGWAGKLTIKEKAPTVVLEAVADYKGWMWHLFFGMPGSHNKINVLDRSHLSIHGSHGWKGSFGIVPNQRYTLLDGLLSCGRNLPALSNTGSDNLQSSSLEEKGMEKCWSVSY